MAGEPLESHSNKLATGKKHSEIDEKNPGVIADKIDYTILSNLQEFGRMTNAELAERVGLSPSAMLRRVQILEDSGIISNYTARLDAKQLGYRGNVFVHVSLTSQAQNILNEFEEAVKNIPQIMECSFLAGESDYLLRVVVGGIEDYEKFYVGTLISLPHVSRIQSLFTLKTVVRKTSLPISNG